MIPLMEYHEYDMEHQIIIQELIDLSIWILSAG
jgi:hypothetical protein